MTKYALDIVWDTEDELPTLVGPFDSREEAQDWAKRNIVNGASKVRSMGRPYWRAS